MTIENLLAGLQILVKAGAKGDCVCAQHDVLYTRLDEDEENTRLSETDKIKLERLGWYWSEENDCWGAFT